MSVTWPEEDDDFARLVNNAMSDYKSELASKLRDALGQPDVITRTVVALNTIIDQIEAQLESSWSDDHKLRTERARERMLERLDMYTAVESLHGVADG